MWWKSRHVLGLHLVRKVKCYSESLLINMVNLGLNMFFVLFIIFFAFLWNGFSNLKGFFAIATWQCLLYFYITWKRKPNFKNRKVNFVFDWRFQGLNKYFILTRMFSLIRESTKNEAYINCRVKRKDYHPNKFLCIIVLS